MTTPAFIKFTESSNYALIVIPEIYGINDHIVEVCTEYHALQYDVYCLDFSGKRTVYPYKKPKSAYADFMQSVGFDAGTLLVETASKALRSRYERVFLLGFSVGATIAWISTGTGVYDGAVCLYGSRIRDYLHVSPQCPTLAVFAKHEISFKPEAVAVECAKNANTQVEVLDASHGFCDRFSKAFSADAAEYAATRTKDFLSRLCLTAA